MTILRSGTLSRAQVPGVAVPDVGSDVSNFIRVLDAGRYFEPVLLSKEDFERAAMYANKAEKAALESSFANYGEYPRLTRDGCRG